MKQQQLFTSNNEHWMTPEDFLEVLYQFAPVFLDPCSHPNSFVKAKTKVCPPNDGLALDWHLSKGLVYCNPPYGKKLIDWVRKAITEYAKGAEIVMLLPARVETKAFQNWIFPACTAVCFLKGRLGFKDGRDLTATKNKATFPSVVVYFGPNVDKFKQVFDSQGKVFT